MTKNYCKLKFLLFIYTCLAYKCIMFVTVTWHASAYAVSLNWIHLLNISCYLSDYSFLMGFPQPPWTWRRKWRNSFYGTLPGFLYMTQTLPSRIFLSTYFYKHLNIAGQHFDCIINCILRIHTNMCLLVCVGCFYYALWLSVWLWE